MVLYRVFDNGDPVKRHVKKLAPTATLVGWDDEGGDPVFVAVLSRHNEAWGKPNTHTAVECAQREMLRRLKCKMGSPQYILKGQL